MMTRALIVLIGCICTSCTNPNIPQRDFQLFAPLPPKTGPEVEAAKNAFVRALVSEIRDNIDSAAFLSISAQNPRGQNFAPFVEQFGERAAVPYSEDAPTMVVRYALTETEGSWSGPYIYNYVLSANLVLLSSQVGGAELLKVSEKRFMCKTNNRGSTREACSLLIPRYAEEVLYNFEDP